MCIAEAKRHLQQAIDDRKELTIQMRECETKLELDPPSKVSRCIALHPRSFGAMALLLLILKVVISNLAALQTKLKKYQKHWIEVTFTFSIHIIAFFLPTGPPYINNLFH